MAIVTLSGVKKQFGQGENRVTALDGIDLSIERGEFIAVVGASGSGKSTLLHILGSVDRPTAGSVEVDGVEVGKLNPTEAAVFRRTKVGIVYQFYNLIPTLTVERNILLPVLLDKRKVDRAYFTQLVDILGIGDKLKALPHQLSGGQQQRVAIARAMIHRPALVLADEPTGNLDQRNSREIVDLLKRMSGEMNQTILLITHDERIAQEADRVVTIADGRIADDRRRR